MWPFGPIEKCTWHQMQVNNSSFCHHLLSPNALFFRQLAKSLDFFSLCKDNDFTGLKNLAELCIIIALQPITASTVIWEAKLKIFQFFSNLHLKWWLASLKSISGGWHLLSFSVNSVGTMCPILGPWEKIPYTSGAFTFLLCVLLLKWFFNVMLLHEFPLWLTGLDKMGTLWLSLNCSLNPTVE